MAAKKRKKRPPKRDSPKSKPRLKVDVAAPEKCPGRTGFHWLRRLACIEFVTSERGVSARDMATNPMYGDHISAVTLERWCAADRWIKQREEYFEKLKEQLKEKIGSAIVQTRMRQLKEVQEMLTEVRKRMLPVFDKDGVLIFKGAEVKSYEGMVQAYVRLMNMEMKLQDTIAEQVVPERYGGTRQGVERAVPQLDTTEIRAAAKAIIHKRREEARLASEKVQITDNSKG